MSRIDSFFEWLGPCWAIAFFVFVVIVTLSGVGLGLLIEGGGL